MNKWLLKLGALALVPCLLTDVVGGNATTYHAVDPPSFEEQALTLALVGGYTNGHPQTAVGLIRSLPAFLAAPPETAASDLTPHAAQDSAAGIAATAERLLQHPEEAVWNETLTPPVFAQKYSPVSRHYSEMFKIESSLPLTFRPAIFFQFI